MQPAGNGYKIVAEWKRNKEVDEKAQKIIEKGVKRDRDLLMAIAEYGITEDDLNILTEEKRYKREIINRLIMN